MTALTRNELIAVYRGVFGRDPEGEHIFDQFCKPGISLEGMIRNAVRSDEFAAKYADLAEAKARQSGQIRVTGRDFLSPRELRRDGDLPPRVLLIGSCLLDRWGDVIDDLPDGVQTDRLHIDAHPSVEPPHPWSDYRYQIVQLPFRHVLDDRRYIDWLLKSYPDEDYGRRALEAMKRRLDQILERATVWSSKKPIFLLNFLTPLQNSNGRLLGDDSPRDMTFLVRALNAHLAERIARLDNVYLVDMERVAAAMGKRFFQEDVLWIFSHGGLANDDDYQRDRNRIAPVRAASAHFDWRQKEFIATVFNEIEEMYRSVTGQAAVKMVCFDLDDTLWNGVLAEKDYVDPVEARAGWPLGMIEVLATLKRRGIILCMLSKNSEDRVREIWNDVYGNMFSLDEFAILKINWKSKVDNVREAIREANILPNSVVFVDDNPVEREAVQAAFPEIRVPTAPHYLLKRILLWSPETQPRVITEESSRRNEMVRAQITREDERERFSREDFLRDLGLVLTVNVIEGRANPRFPRVLELLNKTNQFNTTGRRWTLEELDEACARGIVMSVDAKDKFSSYGLVAVGIAVDGAVRQVVMSCRVVGMDVELALMALLTQSSLRHHGSVTGAITVTKANILSRDLFERCGWHACGEGDWKTDVANPLPAHVTLASPGTNGTAKAQGEVAVAG